MPNSLLETRENRLGALLKDWRARLDPVALGFSAARRRTPGLRREEVAGRAAISPTWYTWLEQGRGGAPSADVLDRIAHALMLTDAERERVFLLGLGRPPEALYRADRTVTPRLQRVLDALDPSPALIRTATWDVVAWNRAATVILTDYAAVPADQRNILRLIFLNPRARAAQADWQSVARTVVAAFRLDAIRAGADGAIAPLVEDLRRLSPEFAAMWQEADTPGHEPGDGTKQITHPVLGPVTLEHSTFAVDGRQDLAMIVYNPTDATVRDRLAAIIAEKMPDPAA
ncbi:helix-turn-helix transcriptional regulator [Novosphingobium sp.]|uniref:helix-turn-helix transcriptional regulator n=1 Tax=Novosphingobium sp. TaxID=1874826 RepID=UPI003B52A2DE